MLFVAFCIVNFLRKKKDSLVADDQQTIHAGQVSSDCSTVVPQCVVDVAENPVEMSTDGNVTPNSVYKPSLSTLDVQIGTTDGAGRERVHPPGAWATELPVSYASNAARAIHSQSIL
jgi:hypothetical protein